MSDSGAPHARLPTAERLQDHLRENARRQYDSRRVPPFTAYFHPDDDLVYYNYAIPDAPPEGRRVPVLGGHEPAGTEVDARRALPRLAEAFLAKGRRLRFEFLEECHPGLPAVLEEAGLKRALRMPLMGYTRASWRAAPDVAGLKLEPILPSSPWSMVRAFLTVQREAFGLLDDAPVPEQAPPDAWHSLAIGAGVLAFLDGEPAGAGGFTPPRQGLSEIVGIATRPRFRGRGVASMVTSALARAAHETGVEVVFLTPGSEESRRIYEKAGFAPCATMLEYVATR